MKTNPYTYSFAILVTFLLTVSCGKTASVAPPPATVSVAERLKKVWKAREVTEGSTKVYSKGGAGNIIPGYDNFVLDLSSPTKVSYNEFDGSRSQGNWSVVSDTQLKLTDLSPQPDGTGGTIEFTISTLNDTQLELTRLTTSPKTGGTTNKYTLSNP